MKFIATQSGLNWSGKEFSDGPARCYDSLRELGESLDNWYFPGLEAGSVPDIRVQVLSEEGVSRR